MPWLILVSRISQEIYVNLAKHGYLERLEKEQTFCVSCNKYVTDTHGQQLYSQSSRFLADRFVEGTCPHCGSDVSSSLWSAKEHTDSLMLGRPW